MSLCTSRQRQPHRHTKAANSALSCTLEPPLGTSHAPREAEVDAKYTHTHTPRLPTRVHVTFSLHSAPLASSFTASRCSCHQSINQSHAHQAHRITAINVINRSLTMADSGPHIPFSPTQIFDFRDDIDDDGALKREASCSPPAWTGVPPPLDQLPGYPRDDNHRDGDHDAATQLPSSLL